jgi:hypothetical protein
MTPRPRFASWDTFNTHLEEQCRNRQRDVLRGHRESIGARLVRDQEMLTTLSPISFDACDRLATRVNSLSLVRYRNNDYSVPVAFGHQEVWIRGYVHEVIRAIIAETAKFKTGRMLFYYGCTGRHARHYRLCTLRGARGADGAIIAAPAYICASNDDIVQFCLEVANASEIPLGFYNNPPWVNTDLTVPDLFRIAEHPRFVVLKESTTRVGQIAQMCAATPDMSLMCCCSPNLGLAVPLMA